ncbi:hypothetical protein C8R45DRAFT_530077 [Mycena sanguinolenta]|nr:hypothetical protein C8R45DRAFT_530077 [Mycena sanguinolenta]
MSNQRASRASHSCSWCGLHWLCCNLSCAGRRSPTVHCDIRHLIPTNASFLRDPPACTRRGYPFQPSFRSLPRSSDVFVLALVPFCAAANLLEMRSRRGSLELNECSHACSRLLRCVLHLILRVQDLRSQLHLSWSLDDPCSSFLSFAVQRPAVIHQGRDTSPYFDVSTHPVCKHLLATGAHDTQLCGTQRGLSSRCREGIKVNSEC